MTLAQTSRGQTINIPPGPLPESLKALGYASNINIVFDPTLVRNLKAPEISEARDAREALTRLLAGTPIRFKFINEKTVSLIPPQTTATTSVLPPAGEPREGTLRLAQAEGQNGQSKSDESSDEDSSRRADESSARNLDGDSKVLLQEVLVTGTHIKGAQLTSPIIRISQDDMRVSAQTTLGEVFRALPQNFSGGQNPGVALGAADSTVANQNLTGGSSLNLRGLGPDATLTLLNGRRLPYDSFVQAMDASVIPTVAVDRVEIVLDGASSIYGSDAVGGVANVVLKRDFSGAEVSARYGFSTDGGNDQTQYVGAAGSTWGSGGFLVAGDFSRNTPVRARDRDYLDAMPNPGVIVYPRLEQTTFILNGHQSLGDSAEVTLAAYHAKRETNLFSQTAVKFFRNTDTANWGILPALNLELPGDWSVSLEGSYGENESESSLPIFLISDVFLFEQRTCYCNKSQSADIRTEGPLGAIAGRPIRLSVGAGYVENTFRSVDLFTGLADTSGSSRSRHAYAELYLPVVGQEQKIPFVDSLALSAAARYEDYRLFGNITTPKLGLVWDLMPSVQVKASWGKSFKVPTLTEQFQPTILNLNSAVNDIPGAPAGSTYLLIIGGNERLEPERARVTTAGITLRPASLPGFRAEMGWFDIDYSDRVVAPLGARVDIDAPEFVVRDPTLAQQNAAISGADQFPNFSGAPYDPGTVLALFDNRFTNSAAQHTRGVDLTLEHSLPVRSGSFTTRGVANWIEGDRRNTSFSPETPVVGVVFFPPRFHARASMIWSKSGLALAAHVNHSGGVDNIYTAPQQRVSAMTTLDLVADYQGTLGPLGAMGLSLSVLNAFDRHPPYMQPTNSSFVPYDSTNYSPLGRIISATLAKRF